MDIPAIETLANPSKGGVSAPSHINALAVLGYPGQALTVFRSLCRLQARVLEFKEDRKRKQGIEEVNVATEKQEKPKEAEAEAEEKAKVCHTSILTQLITG